MIQKQTVYLPVNGEYLTAVCHFEYTEWCHHETVQSKEGYFFTSLEIQDIFTIFARENNISQEKVKIFLNDNFK